MKLQGKSGRLAMLPQAARQGRIANAMLAHETALAKANEVPRMRVVTEYPKAMGKVCWQSELFRSPRRG